jgi:hypothetical protein
VFLGKYLLMNCKLLCVLFLFPVFIYAQDVTRLSVISRGNTEYITAYKFNEELYFSIENFSDILSVKYNKPNSENIELEFPDYSIKLTAKNPYLVLNDKRLKKNVVYQLSTSTLLIKGSIFVPLKSGLKPLAIGLGKDIAIDNNNQIIISEKSYVEERSFEDKGSDNKDKTGDYNIAEVTFSSKDNSAQVRIHSNRKISSYKTYYKDGVVYLILKDAQVDADSIRKFESEGIIDRVNARNVNDNAEIQFFLKANYERSEIVDIAGSYDILLRINMEDDLSEWYETESKHFKIVYREAHSFLAPHILKSAESALKVLMDIFDYTPSEKIIINTYDASDYGFGSATAVPENYIRLEIEPLEPGYENIPYNDRFQWLLSHELVHVVVNDLASESETLSRKIFSKVAPEQVQPLTIFYSLLTNYSRYTPRWHQEAIAVFMETWLSGGFGRTLGNFDEMYFRSMVVDNEEFPSQEKLDAELTHNSFLLETLFYLYGARFASYIAIKYDADKLIAWFRTMPGDFYGGFKNKFKAVFKIDFDEEWNNFILYEKNFQQENIKRLKAASFSPVKRLVNKPIGWVTQPYYDPADHSVIWGDHRPHHLARIQKFNLVNSKSEEIGSIQTPSMYQVASTAFDFETGLFFYTTNNNQLYRDVWALDVETGDRKLLFKDSRIGNISVSPLTHELWGVQHSGGKASLIYSPYPYNLIEQVTQFNLGDEIQQLAVSPSGKYLAVTLLRASGQQSIILVNCDSLKMDKPFLYESITATGTPENPSWSADERFIYWNAYSNGVSNIYRMDFSGEILKKSSIEAVSHTLRGLFKPIYLSEDSLFAFEFTSEGLIPVLIPNKPISNLPAIHYLGEEVIKKNNVVYNWLIKPAAASSSMMSNYDEEVYNGLLNLKILTFIPVITGFQKQKVLGFFTHIADPLINHDLIMEFGYSPFNENPLGPKFHFKGKYEYKKRYIIGIDHNATDFYDLFNERKRGTIGTKIKLGHVHYWVYDNPLKIKQESEITAYTGFKYFNDNIVKVSEPDFLVAQTIFNSKDLRRSIGSSDFESGNEFTATAMFFGENPDNPQYSGQLFTEWDNYSIFIANHNVFHFKLAAGYNWKNENLFQAQFFFGGFGNREVENVDVKQFRKVFRLPGIPIYSLYAERFAKVMVEDNLPPIRFSNASIGQHYLSHIDFSVYSQGLIVKSPLGTKWVDVGAQLNLIFKHWFNLESTLSAGIANAWFEGGNDWEWFISYKLLKN